MVINPIESLCKVGIYHVYLILNTKNIKYVIKRNNITSDSRTSGIKSMFLIRNNSVDRKKNVQLKTIDSYNLKT